MKVEELYIYPIKSARSQSIKEMALTNEGPEGDRQWTLIDETGKFLSQRTLPKLATVEVFNEQDALTIAFEKTFFKVSKKSSFQRKVQVTVWNDTFEAALEPDLYSQALSQYLGVNCRLVRYAPYSQRRVKTESESWKPEVRFADGRPLQLLNLKSLEDLNSKLAKPVGVDRFRANIIFQGTQAFEEEAWKRIKIGEVYFSLPKKCARCTIITMDQKTGASDGPEPLKTLASYRRDEKAVNFGTLWIPENEGKIRQGDLVEVVD